MALTTAVFIKVFGSKPMNIWLVCHQFLPEFYAGTETITFQTALQLRRNGHEVTVVTGHPELIASEVDPVWVEKYNYEGLAVRRFRNSGRVNEGHDFERLLYHNQGVADSLRQLLDVEPKPDIVHVLHFAFVGLAILPVFKEHGIPICFTSTDFFSVCPVSHLRNIDGTPCRGPRPDHGNCLRHLLHNILPPEFVPLLSDQTDDDMGNLVWLSSNPLPEKISGFLNPGFANQVWFRRLASDLVERKKMMVDAFESIDLMIAPSKAVQAGLVENGVGADTITLLPYGIDTSGLLRSVQRGKHKNLKLAFIGQIAEHKGLKVLLEAMRLLPASLAVELAVYGDISFDKFYGDAVTALAKGDSRIKFHGSFAGEMLGATIAKHDILVIPSLWSENTPVVLLASQASGCPAVVSREAGLCEIVQDGLNGLTFETGNAAELSQCILRLAQDRSLVARLAAGTAPGFSIAENVSVLESLYHQAMDKVGSSNRSAMSVMKPVSR